MRKYGVADSWLVEDTHASTLHKMRVLADGQYIVRLDEGHQRTAHGDQERQRTVYTEATCQQILQYLDELYVHYDVIVVSDYCYSVISPDLIERLRRLQVAHPKPLLVDSKALLRFQHLPMTVVTPNYPEAVLLLKQIKGEGEARQDTDTVQKDATEIARQLQECISAEHIVITLAKDGALLVDRQGHVQHLPVPQVKHANDVGAGDSFAAALALALAAGGTIGGATRIALDAAEIAVKKARTAIVEHQELLQQVSLRVYTSHIHEQNGGAQEALEQLTVRLDIERLLGKTIVFTNGVFDILHAGHIQFLRQARTLGDVLVVGVNSDQSVRRLKGEGRPINSERDRLALVAALDMVNYTILFDEDTPISLIRKLRPNIHAKGGDYAEGMLPEATIVHEVGGQVVILPLVEDLSTSSMIERIAAMAVKISEGEQYAQ